MARRSTKKASVHDIMEAKWAINSIHSTYGDTEMSVAEVVDFMEVTPKKGTERDAVTKGAAVYFSEFGVLIDITGARSNPMSKSRGRTVTFKSGKRAKKSSAPMANKKVSIPKGKRKGDHFTKNGKHYTVVSYVKNGKRLRFARRL